MLLCESEVLEVINCLVVHVLDANLEVLRVLQLWVCVSVDQDGLALKCYWQLLFE